MTFMQTDFLSIAEKDFKNNIEQIKSNYMNEIQSTTNMIENDNMKIVFNDQWFDSLNFQVDVINKLMYKVISHVNTKYNLSVGTVIYDISNIKNILKSKATEKLTNAKQFYINNKIHLLDYKLYIINEQHLNKIISFFIKKYLISFPNAVNLQQLVQNQFNNDYFSSLGMNHILMLCGKQLLLHLMCFHFVNMYVHYCSKYTIIPRDIILLSTLLFNTRYNINYIQYDVEWITNYKIIDELTAKKFFETKFNNSTIVKNTGEKFTEIHITNVINALLLTLFFRSNKKNKIIQSLIDYESNGSTYSKYSEILQTCFSFYISLSIESTISDMPFNNVFTSVCAYIKNKNIETDKYDMSYFILLVIIFGALLETYMQTMYIECKCPRAHITSCKLFNIFYFASTIVNSFIIKYNTSSLDYLSDIMIDHIKKILKTNDEVFEYKSDNPFYNTNNKIGFFQTSSFYLRDMIPYALYCEHCELFYPPEMMCSFRMKNFHPVFIVLLIYYDDNSAYKNMCQQKVQIPDTNSCYILKVAIVSKHKYLLDDLTVYSLQKDRTYTRSNKLSGNTYNIKTDKLADYVDIMQEYVHIIIYE